MAAIYDDIKKTGGDVLVVSFTPPEKVAAYVAKYPQPFPVVSDTTRAAYQAFALGAGTLGSFVRPGVLWRFLGIMLHGWLPKPPDKDTDIWQLGGDFLLDGAGFLRYAHPSSEPTDRPNGASLLGAFRQATKRP